MCASIKRQSVWVKSSVIKTSELIYLVIVLTCSTMDSFVCKIVILENKDRRIMKSKKIDVVPTNVMMKIIKANPIKKCLFGLPNIADTEKMLEEQLDIDRKRFSDRFGFDLKEIERLDMEANNENVNTISGENQSSTSRKMKRLHRERRRAVFRPYNVGNSNQSVMTGKDVNIQ